jgi:hypothetical protein
MKLSTIQSEAIIWAMFAAENEIQHIRVLLEDADDYTKLYEDMLKKRHEHWRALKELLEEK